MDNLDTHRLIRLKRYEQPSNNSVEEFIIEFQRRQRVALLSPSLGLKLKERLAHFIADFQVPTMAYVTATALALFFSVLILHNDNFAPRYYDTASLHRVSTGYTNQIPSRDHLEPVSLHINNDGDATGSSVRAPSYFSHSQDSPKTSLLSL